MTPGLFQGWKVVALCVIFSLCCSSCGGGIGISPYYKPPGVPIKLSVDNNGSVSVALEGIELLTPIGTFGVELDLHTPELSGKKVLAVRMKNVDTVYDLQEHTITKIEFEPGYYSAVNIEVRDGSAVILELVRTDSFNPSPTTTLHNPTEIESTTGRRSCSQTAFFSGMKGQVVESVRLRHEPFIPEDVDENWAGSLIKNEVVLVRDIKCNTYGTWLYVERSNGQKGWAKEWGLSRDLVEITFIVPAR